MSKQYEEFMVYELENSGERKKLNISQDELQNHLHPEQVLIIIREDLRRIFIWKGAKSPVRKRFISSRVAQQIQKELINDSRYHRCKIVSIDQGDELQEFLNVFKLESMEVTERLPDMRYIRNIEKEKMKQAQKLGSQEQSDKTEEYYSPALADLDQGVVKSSIQTMRTRGRSPLDKMKSSEVLSTDDKEKIKEKILDISIPDEFERQNLILGYELYGAVSKVSDVLGKNIKEIVWEKVNKLPKGVIELDKHKLRVYLDQKKGIVEAVEVLKMKNDSDLHTTESKTSKKRELPKIPSDSG